MHWFGIFSRRTGKTRQPPPAADEWQAGELAECIYRGPWFLGGYMPVTGGPQFGERYVVQGVCADWASRQMLVFARFAPRRYAASGFRKVTPRADEAIAADAAFLGGLIAAPTPVHGPAKAPEPVR